MVFSVNSRKFKKYHNPFRNWNHVLKFYLIYNFQKKDDFKQTENRPISSRDILTNIKNEEHHRDPKDIRSSSVMSDRRIHDWRDD